MRCSRVEYSGDVKALDLQLMERMKQANMLLSNDLIDSGIDLAMAAIRPVGYPQAKSASCAHDDLLEAYAADDSNTRLFKRFRLLRATDCCANRPRASEARCQRQ